MSVRRARIAAIALAGAGIGVATYLTFVHYAGFEPLCTGISDCERVQTSRYAELGGVPVALIGLVGYVAILAAALVPARGAHLVGAYLAFTGAGFSVYLTWVELEQIDAICQWCIVSAALMVGLAVIALLRTDDAVEATPGPASPGRRPTTRSRASHRASRRVRASR